MEDDENYGWPGVRVLCLHETESARRLKVLRSYLDATQHDSKAYDFLGRPRTPGNSYLDERLKGHDMKGAVPQCPPPLSECRPDAPVHAIRRIVKLFTDTIYPIDRPPRIDVVTDRASTRYLNAIFRASSSWSTLREARDIAGACRQSAIRLWVRDGTPYSEAIDTAELHVREWSSQVDRIPRVVVWQRLVEKDEETAQGLECRRYWQTRVFDDEYEYEYEDVPENYGRELSPGLTRDDGETAKTGWIPIATDDDGEPKIYEHHAGRCPIVWIQSSRNTSDLGGELDAEGGHELADAIDLLASGANRSAKSNADPTVTISDTRSWHMTELNRPVKKGGRIDLSEQGKADLLEISGSAMDAGQKVLAMMRRELMQLARCVIVDPENAQSFTAQSGRAARMLWKSMHQAVAAKRGDQEGPIRQICGIWISIGKSVDEITHDAEEAEGDVIVLPPTRVHRAEAEKLPPGTPEIMRDGDHVVVGHAVGEGGHAAILWPSFTEADGEELSAHAASLVTATGGSKILSQETGVRAFAGLIGADVDAREELDRIRTEDESRMAALFEQMGQDEDDDSDEDDESGSEESEDEGQDESSDSDESEDSDDEEDVEA